MLVITRGDIQILNQSVLFQVCRSVHLEIAPHLPTKPNHVLQYARIGWSCFRLLTHAQQKTIYDNLSFMIIYVYSCADVVYKCISAHVSTRNVFRGSWFEVRGLHSFDVEWVFPGCHHRNNPWQIDANSDAKVQYPKWKNIYCWEHVIQIHTMFMNA